jgi:hypothetical protein
VGGLSQTRRRSLRRCLSRSPERARHVTDCACKGAVSAPNNAAHRRCEEIENDEARERPSSQPMPSGGGFVRRPSRLTALYREAAGATRNLNRMRKKHPACR